MADKEVNTEKNAKPAAGDDKKAPPSVPSKMLPMLVIVAAVMICSIGGFFSARIFAPKSASASVDANAPKEVIKPKEKKASSGHGGEAKKATNAPSAPGESWFFELEPVVANLDEPGVTRYVRASLIMEMLPEADYETNNTLLEEKKALMRNWVTIYLAGCTLDDIRGRKNLVRIQAEIKDNLNEMLFKNSKPLISRMLFKEFQIQ